MLKIGVDAMGGDFAPEAAVKGAVMAVDAIGDECRIVLFGDEDRIRAVLKAENCAADRFDIVHTTEVIEMGDHPAKAFQQKTNSSIVVGFGYLAKGLINGFASAGSTGAMMVGSMQAVKPIEGVIRPTISTVAPTVTGGKVLLLDVGLNVDCKPEVLAQYGIIGSIYAQAMLGIRNPRVAVLNIGEEETKGNAQSKAAYELMKESEEFNFVGNVEVRLFEKVLDLFRLNRSKRVDVHMECPSVFSCFPFGSLGVVAHLLWRIGRRVVRKWKIVVSSTSVVSGNPCAARQAV